MYVPTVSFPCVPMGCCLRSLWYSALGSGKQIRPLPTPSHHLPTRRLCAHAHAHALVLCLCSCCDFSSCRLFTLPCSRVRAGALRPYLPPLIVSSQPPNPRFATLPIALPPMPRTGVSPRRLCDTAISIQQRCRALLAPFWRPFGALFCLPTCLLEAFAFAAFCPDLST
jgi:hypothetical protein